jgi:hypothetical protein
MGIMSSSEQKRKLVGPWRSVQVALWLIGLGVLALTGKWWPGILFLIALSLLLEALLRRFAPHAFEESPEELREERQASEAVPPPTTPVATGQPIPAPEHRLELLPSECPKCGGPIRGVEVNWTGSQSADCPYCGANLPMQGA